MTPGYRPKIIQSEFVDFIGSRLNPFWSLTVPKLRLVARYALSDDLIALKFAVNSVFKRQAFKTNAGWQGGQYLNLKVLIDGIYHQRSYSLVGMAHQPLWWHSNKDNRNINNKKNNNAKELDSHTLTIALKPQGLVSDYLTGYAAIGSVFDTSLPSGDFTLEQIKLPVNQLSNNDLSDSTANKAPLLFIAGGSGITPMLGLITQALQRGHQVTLLHYNRTALLDSYWSDLATKYADFSYYLIDTKDASTYLAGSRHLTAQSLLALGLPLANTQIFACGSQALLTSLYQAAEQIALPDNAPNASLRDNIIVERFGSTLPELNADITSDMVDDISPQTVHLRMRQRQFSSDSTLLVAAERAGIRLTHGCRQGICHMCRCDKISGVVRNIQTGKLSSDGYESIQTCVNIAVTDVVLDI